MENSQLANLLSSLMHLYARWRQVSFLRGLMCTLGFCLASLIAGCFIDYIFDLTMLLRILLTCCVYGSVLVYGFVFWLRPTFIPRSIEQIAWLIERECPDLNQRLISSVELRNIAAESVSQEMIAKVLSRVQIDMAKIKPSVPFPIQRKLFRFPLIALAVFLLIFPIPQLHMPQLIVRVLAPSPKQGGVGSFELTVSAPTTRRFTEGDSVFFIVRSSDAAVREISLFFQDLDKRVRRERVIRNEETGDFHFTLAGVYGDLDFWAKAGKVSTPVRRLMVTKRPKLEYFQVQLTPPPYTGMPKTEYQSTSGDLRALVDTHVRLVLYASKPLSALVLTVDGEKIPVDLASDRRSGWCQMVVNKSTSYTITLRDENGLGSPGGMKYDITMLPDQAPKVSLYEPESDLYLSQDERVHFEWSASDDFGVVSHELQCILGGGTVHTIRLPSEDQEFDLGLASLRLQPGDEVGFKVTVRDAVNQTAQSELRTITIVNSGELANASRFITRLEQVGRELKSASARLDEIGSSIREVIDGQKTNVAKSTDLAYHLIMLQHRIGRFDLKLEDILARVADLRDASFFPYCHQAVELIRLRLFRQRVFGTYHQIEDMDAIEEGQMNCKSLLSQVKSTVYELKRHANYCIANTISEHLLASVDRLDMLPDDEIQDSLKRFVRKGHDLAVMTRSRDQKGLRKLLTAKSLRRTQAAVSLRRFYENNVKDMRDYRQLDRQTKQLAYKFPSLENDLAELIEQLELNNRKRDWETVERLKATLEARRRLRAAELVDNDLLSRFLARAIEEKSDRLVRFATHALPRMTVYHSWSRFQPLLATSATAFDAAAETVVSNLSDKRRPSSAEREQLGRLLLRQQDNMRILLNFPFGSHRLQDDKKSVLVKRLLAASQGIDSVIKELAHKPAKDIKGALGQISKNVRLALSNTVSHVTEAKGRRDLSRKSLLKELAPPSERLVEIRNQIEVLEEDLETITAGEVHKVEKISHELGKVIRIFERKAFVDIGQKEGDARSARNRMAIAVQLETIREKRLKRAAEIVVNLDADGDESERYASILEIREALLSAMQDLRDITDMMLLSEAFERGELSLDDSLQNERLLTALAQKNLDHNVLQLLDVLNTVRNASSRTGALALRIRQLREKEAPGKEFLYETAEIEQRLLHSLEELNPAVLSMAARRHAFRTRMTIDNFLAEIRQITQRGKRSLGSAERSQIGAELRERLQTLSSETARMTAFRKLLGIPGSPSQSLVEQTLLADLAAVFAQLDRSRGRVSFTSVAKTLVELRRTIDAAADELYPRARRPASAVDVNTLPGKLPSSVAENLDAMKHAIALPEMAAEVARNLDAQITKNKRDARKLLNETAQEVFRDAKLKEYLKRQLEQFDKASLAKKASILADVGERLPAGLSDRKEKFSTFVKALLIDQATDLRRRRLVDLSHRSSTHGVGLAARLLVQLEQLPQRAIVNDCRRIIEHFSDNMKLGDFAAASRTLVALRRNVRLFETGLPSREGLVQKSEEDRVPAADEFNDEAFLPPGQLDWFARRALVRIRALGKPRLREQNVAAEKSALLGNYAAAARFAHGVGVMDFSRAAWHLEVAPLHPEELADQYADPLPLRRQNEPWPMNEEAFHASALASLVGNLQAVQFARAGRYAEAADSMDEVAEALKGREFEGKACDASFRAAEIYRLAGKAQLEELPRQLAEAIRKAEAEVSGFSGGAKRTLVTCILLSRQKRFVEAKQALDAGEARGRGASSCFKALGAALLAAQKEHKVKLSRLPKGVCKMIEQIKMVQRSTGQLADAFLDITLFELSQANKEIQEANYGGAAEHLLSAAHSLQGSDRTLMRKLSQELSQLDNDTYATVNPPARRAIRLLKRPRPEIIEAALTLDYQKAAQLADKVRERSSAAAFREADAFQSEALSPAVTQAAALLEEASVAVDLPRKSRDLIRQAARYLRENREADALLRIEIVTTPMTSRLELAQSVQESLKFKQQHVAPLLEAQSAARRNQFNVAVDIARRSRFGGDAIPVLQQAEEATDNGIRAALRASFEATGGKKASLETAARHARNNDLISAIARANAAGMSGRVAAQRFISARRLGEQADRLLQSAVKQANAGNTPAQKALNAIQEELKTAPETVKRLLTQIKRMIEEQRFEDAAYTARRVDPGALLALFAKQKLRGKGVRRTTHQGPSLLVAPSTYAQDLADAVADLERAHTAFRREEPIDVAADALVSSFNELTRSVEAITQRTAKLVRKQLVERYDDATLESLTSGIDRVALERNWARRFSNRPLVSTPSFHSQFLIQQKQDFKAYYRDANRQYLKWIARESKRWQAEDTEY